MASDYQGETIQVFVFLRGKFLGYQCFGQDRITVGGASEVDLPLPDCPEEEGYWDVYVSRGALYAWLRSPAGGNGKQGHGDPQKVLPLDSLSLGEYRLQAKLLVGQGFVQPSTETEEGLPEEESASTPEEESAREEPPEIEQEQGEEELQAGSSPEIEGEEGPVQETAPEPSDEVEGISLDYARSIWKGETEDEPTEADEAEAEALTTAPEEDPGPAEQIDVDAGEEGPVPSLALEEAEAASLPGIDLDDANGFWRLSEESDTMQQDVAGSDAETDEPEPLNDQTPTTDEIEEWIGFGLEEEQEAPITLAEEEPPEGTVEMGSAVDVPAAAEPSEEAVSPLAEEEGPSEEEVVRVSEEASLADSAGEPEGREDRVPLETDRDAQTSVAAPLAAEPDGLVEGMSQEERTGFWDEMARETLPKAKKSEEAVEPDQAPAEASPPDEPPVDAIGDVPPEEDEVELEEEQKPAPAVEPAFASERMERANTALAIDDAEADEGEDWDFDDEEDESEQDIPYFSLVKEVFPNRTKPSKTPRGDYRALEVLRFRGSDVQDIGYLESGGAYTIRKGWSRSLWKRRGGVPPNFKLVRLKNGGLAELHIRDAVKGRLYSNDGSQDIWDLQGGKRGRFGLKGKASWLPLPADTWAVLRVNSGRYLVRYVSPRPRPTVQPLRPKVSMGQFKLVSLSMLSHILLIMVIGLAVPDRTLEGYSRTDQFARIDPNALNALKPPPPPKKLDKPKPVAKKEAPKPKPKPQVASKHRIPKSAQKSPVPSPGKAGGGAKKQVDVAQTGLLAALGSPDAGVLDAKGNSEILLAAVTNLDAVAVPSDTTTFNLAGVAGKLATSEIQVPTSDIIETVGAAQLIKNGDGTLGAMASKGSGEVRAIVHEPPKAKISIRGGMSREAVLKVVNAHLDEVRDCYERELLHNPGISGKILMEWLIQLDGTVQYAKVKFTNIGHSSDLHSCLQAQVVTWNFPRPKGGEEVLVTFPFLFESMGF